MTPPARVTRAISRTAAGASSTKFRTSCENVASNASLGSGSASAPASTTSTPGTRARQACANASDGSTATTFDAPAAPRQLARERPGACADIDDAHPTSTPAKSHSAVASCGL